MESQHTWIQNDFDELCIIFFSLEWDRVGNKIYECIENLLAVFTLVRGLQAIRFQTDYFEFIDM